MKRYLAFKGDTYYPSQGMGDFYGDYDTKEEAVESLLRSDEDAHLWEYWETNLHYGVVWDSETKYDVWDHWFLEGEA